MEIRFRMVGSTYSCVEAKGEERGAKQHISLQLLVSRCAMNEVYAITPCVFYS